MDIRKIKILFKILELKSEINMVAKKEKIIIKNYYQVIKSFLLIYITC